MEKCERCGNDNDGKYASGRFCCQKCSRGFSTQGKREEINKRVSEKLKGRNVGNSFPKGHQPTKRNKESLYLSYLAKYEKYIDRWKLGLETGNVIGRSISGYVKRCMRNKYDNKCCICDWREVNFYTKRAPLQIHHIDGNFFNTVEENLLLLCPNCHSQTTTFKAKNQRNGSKIVENEKVSRRTSKQTITLNRILRLKMINTKYEFLGKILKRRKVMEEQNSRCPLCGISEEWNGKPLVFEIDHVDGHSSNESRENIRFICPNCHSLTQFYGGANRGNGRLLNHGRPIAKIHLEKK